MLAQGSAFPTFAQAFGAYVKVLVGLCLASGVEAPVPEFVPEFVTGVCSETGAPVTNPQRRPGRARRRLAVRKGILNSGLAGPRMRMMAAAMRRHSLSSRTSSLRPLRRQRVEARPAVVVGRAPFGVDEPALLEPLQRRIQRAVIDDQHVVGLAAGSARAMPCPCCGPKISVRRISRSSVPCRWALYSRSVLFRIDIRPEYAYASGRMSTTRGLTPCALHDGRAARTTTSRARSSRTSTSKPIG